MKKGCREPRIRLNLGEWIHCAQIACIRNSIRPASKMFPFIRELPDPTTFKYEGSELLARLIEGHSYETHPHLYTQHCWNVENRSFEHHDKSSYFRVKLKRINLSLY